MTFHMQQRVRIITPPFRGYAGTVVRVGHFIGTALVEMDDWPPGEEREFDEPMQRNWQLFNDYECEVL